MTTSELLKKIRSLDVRLTTDGVKLLVDAPKGALTDTLKADLVSHKSELIRLLSGKPAAKPDNEITPIFSRILNEVVYFVSHNDREKVKHLSGAVYYLSELEAIVEAAPKPAELKLIHHAKTLFSGAVGKDSGVMN